MKNRLNLIFSLLIVLSMLFAACQQAPAVETQPPAEPVATEAPPAEPVATEAPQPTEPPVSEASPEQLDAAFSGLLAGMKKYNTLDMATFSEQLAGDPKPFLLDVRQPEEVQEKGHIEGAVLIPLRELGDNLDKLPSFDTPIVSYCGSGWRCTIAMTALGAMGWTNVLSLKDNSYTGWVEAGFPTVAGLPVEAPVLAAAQADPALALSMQAMLTNVPEGWGVITIPDLAAEMAETPELVVMDVRKADEVAEVGYIEGSVNLPLEDFITGKDQWPADLDTPIVIHCRTGHRSTMAMAILWSYGYTNVRSLKGGYVEWKDTGYETAGGKAPDVTALLDAAYTNFLADMVKYNTMSLEELNTALGEEPPPFVLDVRQPEEAQEKGHIESAVLIPLRELGANLDKLPAFDTPIVSYCGSGWRCTIAMTALGALGWSDVLSLKGNSFGGWVEAGYPVVAGLPADALSLDAAQPDPVLTAHFEQVTASIPDGWGVITVEDLNLALTENPELIVIDARTASERTEKGIIDAANQLAIPLEEFIAQKANWPADMGAEIVVYCGSGHRSTMAMTMLWSYGYTNVRSLKGGFTAWSEAGFPVAQAQAQ